MSITARQKHLVQTSFKKVEPIAEAAAEIFYAKLFEYDPSLKPLFKGSMQAQGRMLMTTLKTAVESLDNLGALIPVLKGLADRHVDYGVSVHDYTPVGNALLSTLRQGLGADWNPELREAWIAVYKTVADVMRSHAHPEFNPSTYRNTKRYQR